MGEADEQWHMCCLHQGSAGYSPEALLARWHCVCDHVLQNVIAGSHIAGTKTRARLHSAEPAGWRALNTLWAAVLVLLIGRQPGRNGAYCDANDWPGGSLCASTHEGAAGVGAARIVRSSILHS